MAEDLVTQLIIDKIDALGESQAQRFDGVDARLDKMNGRLERHDAAIIDLQTHGAAIDGVSSGSRAQRVGKTAGIGAAAVALFELAKVAADKFWK